MSGVLAAIISFRGRFVIDWDDGTDNAGPNKAETSEEVVNVTGVLTVSYSLDSGALETNPKYFINGGGGTEFASGEDIEVSLGDTVKFRIEATSPGGNAVVSFTVTDETDYIVDTFTLTVT